MSWGRGFLGRSSALTIGGGRRWVKGPRAGGTGGSLKRAAHGADYAPGARPLRPHLHKLRIRRLARTWAAPLALLAPLLALAGGFPAAAEALGLVLRARLATELEPGQYAVLWPSGWA